MLRNDGEKEEFLPHFNNSLLPREGRIAAARNEALKVLHLPCFSILTVHLFYCKVMYSYFLKIYRRQQPTTLLIVFDLDIVGFDVAGVLDSIRYLLPTEGNFSQSLDVVCANGILLHGFGFVYGFCNQRISNSSWTVFTGIPMHSERKE